jgi:hypothetical protein
MSDRSVVMIVDDDDSVRRAARRLIKSFGLAVATFVSADEFLACRLVRLATSSNPSRRMICWTASTAHCSSRLRDTT